MLTRFTPDGVNGAAVTAIVSGNRPRELMQEQRVRYAAYDGRLSDLGVATDPSFVPLISDNWTNHFVWQGVGPMPEAEREKLRGIVRTAHASGQRVRLGNARTAAAARSRVARAARRRGRLHQHRPPRRARTSCCATTHSPPSRMSSGMALTRTGDSPSPFWRDRPTRPVGRGRESRPAARATVRRGACARPSPGATSSSGRGWRPRRARGCRG